MLVIANLQATKRVREAHGGSPNGITGATKSYGDLASTQGWALGFSSTRGAYGSGGGATGSNNVCAAGGTGGYNSTYVDVASGTTVTITVGAGGAGSTDGDNDTEAHAGTAGFVLIAYGGDI